MTTPSTAPASLRTALTPARKLAYALITMALVLGGVELVWRLIHGWDRHWVEMHRFHPVLGWCHREEWEGRNRWVGGYSRINAQGIRADLPALPKPAGEKRLLALGDSIASALVARTRPGRRLRTPTANHERLARSQQRRHQLRSAGIGLARAVRLAASARCAGGGILSQRPRPLNRAAAREPMGRGCAG